MLITKKRDKWVKIAIYMAGYGMFSDNVVIPLITKISEDFTDASLFSLNFVISGCGVAAIIASIFTGILMKYFDKRNLIIAGTVIFSVGGIAGAFSPNITFLAVTRTIDAISDGILTTVTSTLIAQLWKSEKERSDIAGWYNAVSCIFGAFMSIAAGYLAVYSWRFSFLINGVSIIGTIFCILFIPKGLSEPISRSRAASIPETIMDDIPYHPLKLILSLIAYMIISSLCYELSFLINLYVVEKNFGNTVISGYLSFLITAVAFLGCISMSPLYAKIKKLLPSFFSVVAGLFMYLYAIANSPIIAMICGAVVGYMGGIIVVYYHWYIIQNTPRRYLNVYAGLESALIYLNGYLAVYIPSINTVLFHTQTISESLEYSSFGLIVIGILYFLIWVVSRQRN